MEALERQQEPPWATQVVLAVTGVPKGERAAVQELVERAGGMYSPNLSRRCTHLAVPAGVSERSEKLPSALRNRHKWGLHIVDLRWVLESAHAGRRLQEARFPVHFPLPQEQAALEASAHWPADSGVGSDNLSEQAADTCKQPQGHGSLPPATAAAAAARAARPANPLRNSVNSRPLSSFAGGQPAPSLQTQAPSAGRSVRWAVSEGSPSQWGAPSGAAAAAHAAAAAVLPGQVEQRCLVQHTDEEVDFSKLPMTQAGFIPAADLLEQLRASNAGLLPAEPPAQPLPQPARQEQQQQQQQQTSSSSATWQPRQPPAARYAWQGSPEPAGPNSMQVDVATSSLIPVSAPSARVQQAAAPATSTADLLQQLRLSVAGQQLPPPPLPDEQQRAVPVLSTAELLEQLRQPSAGTLRAAVQPVDGCGRQQDQQQQPSMPTIELLQQLHSSAVTAAPLAAAQQQMHSPAPQEQQPEQHQGGRRLATEDLLAALRSAPAGGQTGQQQRQQQLDESQAVGPAGSPGQQQQAQAAPATADLLRQLQAARVPAANQQQQLLLQAAPATVDLLRQLQAAELPAGGGQHLIKRTAPATVDLLQQLQATPAPVAAGDVQRRTQPALSTEELLQHLHASADGLSTGGMQQAQQDASGPRPGAAAAAGQEGITGLLQQPQQFPAAPAPLPQQTDSPAAADVPVVHAEVAAAAASRLADQMRSLLQEAQPAVGLPAAKAMAAVAEERGGAGSGRSTAELVALLRGQQEQQHGSAAQLAPSPAADGGTDELLSKLRSMAPQVTFTPLRPQVPAPAAQPLQQQQVVAPPVQWGAAGPASVDEEMPPAKYQRQDRPEGRAPAPFGAMLAAQQLATVPPATPAAEAVVAGDGAGSLAPTMAVSGGLPEGVASPSASVPSSSAGSPPLARQPAGIPAVPAQGDALSPAGSGSSSGRPDAASSQVAESCRVFGGMLAIVDPGLPADEQQRVAAALQQGGGQVAAGASLARGVTHVVCQPDQALKWLSMGVGIVSPAWVLQSLRTGKQQRCLMVSADASRHLPAASAATHGGSSQHPGSSEAASGGGSRGMHASVQQLSGTLLASKEARQQALMQLAGQGASAAACGGASTPGAPGPSMPGGHRPAATPAELLVGVLWSVLEPPHTARLEERQPRSAQAEEQPIVIPDSEDEEEEQARLCCISASQAAVADVLCEAACAEQPGKGGSGANTAAAWQQDVVLQGPATLTLLLPRDARGELGSDTRCFAVPAGRQARELTVAQLLGFVHAYYAEEVPPAEQLSLLQAHPAAESAAALLRPAFLELTALARGALLGPRCAFEGLRKATRDPAGAVYEVLLGS